MADITRGSVLSYGGNIFQGLSNGTISIGDPVGQDGTGWVRADADGVVSCQGFMVGPDTGSGGVVTGQPIKVATQVVYQTTTVLTIGGIVFLSATAGRLADADPGSALIASQPLGFVVQASPNPLIQLDANIPQVEVPWYQNLTSIMIAAQGAGFYVARRPMRVIGAVETHSVAGTNGSAVTAALGKAAAGTAFASATNVLTTTFNLKSTADTPVYVLGSATPATARLAPGDRLAVVLTGTLTSLVDCAITVHMIPLER